MAEKGSIASSLTLDGEKEYKQALNDAYRTLRVLRSELKAETAELGRNATQQDKARTKTASLQKQIEEQKKIVETLKKALEDSRKEYADNQEVQDKWEEKLNKAREALARMQNDLEDTTDNLKDFSDGMKDVSEESGQAATAVVSLNDSLKSIGTLVSGIGSGIAGVFSATASTMEDMVDKMMELMGKAYAAAGEWKEIQTIWGGDLESIEQVFRGAGLQGVSTGDITSGIQKLVSNVHAGNKETMAAFKAMGIEEHDYESHWDMYVDVMQRLADMASYDKQGADKLARMIFGDKTGSGQTNVLDNWNDMMSKYDQDIKKTGLHLFADEIEELDSVAHKIEEVRGLWNELQTTLGAKLSVILDMGTLTDDVLDILRTVAQIFTNKDETKKVELTSTLSDQITKLIEDISKAVGNLATELKGIGTTLSGSDNSVVSFLGRLIEGFGSVLDWMAQNGDKIVAALDVLLPWMMANLVLEKTTGKGTGEWIDTITQTGFDIAQLGLLKRLVGGGAKGADATTVTATATTVGTWLASKFPFLAGAANGATGFLSGFGNSLGPIGDWFTHNTGLGRTLSGQQTWEDLGEDIQQYGEEVKDNANSFFDDWGGVLREIFGGPGEEAPEAEFNEEDLTKGQREAAEAYWEKLKESPEGFTSYEDWKAFHDAFEGAEAAFMYLDELIEQAMNNPEWRGQGNLLDEDPGKYYDDDEDLYIEEIVEEVRHVDGLLKNWLADHYKGGQATETEVKMEVKSEVTCPVYLDGSYLTSYVSSAIAQEFGRFLGV